MDIRELKEKIKDLKVLFVDDEEEIRQGTGTFLKKFFTDVTICEDGAAGLEQYKKTPVDIVITDVMMPRMNGTTMVKEIKNINPNVFVVFVTAYRDTLDDDPNLADVDIKKPLSYEDLVEVLKTIAQNYSK